MLADSQNTLRDDGWLFIQKNPPLPTSSLHSIRHSSLVLEIFDLILGEQLPGPNSPDHPPPSNPRHARITWPDLPDRPLHLEQAQRRPRQKHRETTKRAESEVILRDARIIPSQRSSFRRRPRHHCTLPVSAAPYVVHARQDNT